MSYWTASTSSGHSGGRRPADGAGPRRVVWLPAAAAAGDQHEHAPAGQGLQVAGAPPSCGVPEGSAQQDERDPLPASYPTLSLDPPRYAVTLA